MIVTQETYRLKKKIFEFNPHDIEKIIEDHLERSGNGYDQPCKEMACNVELEIIEEQYDDETEKKTPAKIILTYTYK